MTTYPAWDVRIQFAEGEYANRVHASSRIRAFNLALQDAYMGSPFGSFHSPVASWEAVLADEVAA